MATMAQQAEAAVLARAAGGDEDAVAALYATYADAIYGFGLRRLGDRALAEELVQAVMTRLWRHARRYDPQRGSVRTWVFTIARTTAIDLHRRQPPAEPVADVPEHGEQPDDLDRLLQAAAVRTALERLTAEHREILELAYYAGMPQSVIANRLGLPLGTVKSRTYYALKAFRLACDELGVDA